MTIAVLTTTSTIKTTTRREPLKPINMATSQARAPPSSSASNPAGKGRATTRPGARTAAAHESAAERVAAGDKKRKATYDEDVEGFQFSRATTKKAKPSEPDQTENGLDEPVQQSPRRGRPPKAKPSKPPNDQPTENTNLNGTANPKPARGRPPKRTSLDFDAQSEQQSRTSRKRIEEPTPVGKTSKKGRPAKPKQVDETTFQSPEPTAGTAKVPLPVADTPVIRRNKEMREERGGKGQRRSSLGMRGRRASSLIDSGASNALPHKEVRTSDFYKHIESDLPEPRRMKQLLTWCATRAMGEKPTGARSEDDNARLAARVIQEELLQDFSNKPELYNWFSREDQAPPAVVVKQPNPKNIQNAEKIKELEEHIKRLQAERQALTALLRAPSIPAYSTAPSGEQRSRDPPSLSAVDSSILDPTQQSLLTRLGYATPRIESDRKTAQQPPSRAQISPADVSSRLSRITTSLAPTLDTFASSLHDIDVYRSTADSLSSRILRICAERLEERDSLPPPPIAGEDSSSAGGDKDRDRDRGGQAARTLPLRPHRNEDIGVVLGALSRLERR